MLVGEKTRRTQAAQSREGAEDHNIGSEAAS